VLAAVLAISILLPVVVALVFAGWVIPVIGIELRRMRNRRDGQYDARRGLGRYRRPGDGR
jgi:hypothetical protein